MNLKPWLALSLVSLTSFSQAFAGPIADLEVKLDSKLEGKQTGIKTLYITVYDAASTMPMPYGAMKIDLSKEAQGVFYKGLVDSTNLRVMGGGELPKSLRIKARLDKDGAAGKDSPGDLVGSVEQIKPGSKSTILIDKAI